MQHPSGVVLNLLGPSNASAGGNILMDTAKKYPGITHVSFKIAALDDAKAVLADRDIAITGAFSFMCMDAIFIRDPDLNVIELDAYQGAEPQTRTAPSDDTITAFQSHPD